MTAAEKCIASRLLDMAGERFHEDSCTDTDPELFDGLDEDEIANLATGFNAWYRGDTGETCGDPDALERSVRQIQVDEWMGYMAAVVGRPATFPAE